MSKSAPATEFDPYYKWLGIPKKDQPPHHYRLLGLEVFEHDAEVIDAAANRLMDYLQSVGAGPRVKESQKLLNEISAARLVLLDAQKRYAYDAKLKPRIESQKPSRAVRQKSAPTPPPAPPRAEALPSQTLHDETWASPAAEATIAEPLVFTSPNKSKTAGRTSTAHHATKGKTAPWIYIAGGGGVLAVIAIVLWLVLGGDDKGDKGDGDSQRIAQKTSPDGGVPIKPAKTNGATTPTVDPAKDPDTPSVPATTNPPNPVDPATTTPPETSVPETSVPETPGTTPGNTDPAPPVVDPDTTQKRLEELLTAANEAIEKDDIEGALKHLEEYAALEPSPPMDVQNMLSMARAATFNEMALKFLQTPQITDGHVTAAMEGTLNIQAPGAPEKLLAALTARVRKLAPQEAKRRGLNVPTPPVVATNPPDPATTPTPMGTDDAPPAQPADSPLAKLQPNDDPQAFLKQALTKKGTLWLLQPEEEAATKALADLAELHKKYLTASKPIEEVLRYRKQIDGVKRQLPPGGVLPEQVRATDAKFGETAYDTNEQVKQAVQAWAAAYDALLLASSQAREKYEQVDGYYQALAADPNVAAAVTKARSGKLGPSQPFKAKRKELDKYKEALAYVPCWRSGQENFVHSLVNGKLPVAFANRPSLNINGLDIKATIQIALCEQSGIELGEAINLTFNGGGAMQQIQCRKVSIPSIRIGPHVLKDVPALAFPPQATFMANALGEGSLDDFQINFLPEEFRFEIEAKGAPPMAE